ncbi:MAG: hypothetical protein WCT05_04080 [Lentisphaeria bacterium]
MKSLRWQVLFVFTMLSAPLLFSGLDGLGESLLLEGRLALFRGENWLVSQQLSDGSWGENPIFTSQAGVILANANLELYSERLEKGCQWLRRNAETLSNAEALAQAIRLPLRIQHPATTVLVRQLRESKKKWMLDGQPASVRQSLLELYYLLPRETAILSENEIVVMQKTLLDDKEQPAFVLLTLLSLGKHPARPEELTSLLTACMEAAKTAALEDLFWIVRALRGYERVFPETAKDWRAAIVAKLLEKQRGDGTFAGTTDSTALKCMTETCFALLTLQLCLAS